jgi:protein phosphatase 1L
MLNDGTTAVVGVIHGQRIYVANAGDSRGIITQKSGKVMRMSIDHKPNREDEEKRIKKLGGRVIHWGRWRVEGVLAVSRAIGDVALQPYVSCEPEIREKDITPEDEYLILASDGVWDVMRNEDVGRLVKDINEKDFINIAKIICQEASLLGSTDNITALVVDLRRKVSSAPSSPKGSSISDKKDKAT